MTELARRGALRPDHRTYLSINRTGLAGTVFELDDRLVATVDRAAADGWTGIKLMTRIDPDDPGGAAALALLGQVLEEARASSLDALIEPVMWKGGRMSRVTDDIVLAAVIAHDLGAPLLKVPVPDVPGGASACRGRGPGGGQRRCPRPVPRWTPRRQPGPRPRRDAAT